MSRTVVGPPLNTDLGWLLVYRGVDDERDYRLGVALLDRADPACVFWRPADFCREPHEPWEHMGDVPHVVLSCATLQVGSALWI